MPEKEVLMTFRRGEFFLLLGSLLFMLLIALIGELAVRSFGDLNFLGNSSSLFVSDAFGSSKGNAPNVEAISFGTVVYTDQHGFRVPRGGLPDDENKPEAILVLGDSIAFGPAVEEGETFVGLLRARFPRKRIYNSAVIGYAAHDYRNVVDAFLPLHDEVTSVVLVYCLNDPVSTSAQDIDRYLKAKKEDSPEPNFRKKVEDFGPLRYVNDFLRSRSKLYLLLKYQLMESQRHGWEEVLALYDESAEANLQEAARDIGEIADRLKQKQIRFVVVLSPFEYQLRNPGDLATQVPQRKIGNLLSTLDVRYIDARPYFDHNLPAFDYFLPYDAMHFSRAGHRVMADLIAKALDH
jgi:lysophospholipase L1-like esterase